MIREYASLLGVEVEVSSLHASKVLYRKWKFT
jgi:hypothetical protein